MAVTPTRRILIADDDPGIRSLLQDVFEDEGYQTEPAEHGGEVLAKLAKQTNIDLLIMDVRMPGQDGLTVLEQLRKAGNTIPVIMMTAHGTSSTAIRAIQIGAYDYVIKPFDVEEVILVVKRLFDHQQLASKVRELEAKTFDPRDKMIGNSQAMQEIYKQIGRVAHTDATVLITGETGTGKEVLANLIHANSARRNGPMVKVNCAALPESLLESELFGHEKGAFTGAMAQRKGRFELAHKGTIFLDEIGEMTLATQKKLLRILQEREFERVGGTTSVRVDVRVIAATNRDLESDVRAGSFREDLFYRLNVITLHLPALRQRNGDIPLLAEFFLDKYRYSPSSPPARISEEAMQRLNSYDWPGNVRQLEHEIERATILSRGGVITSEHLSLGPVGRSALQLDIAARVREGSKIDDLLADVERLALQESLAQHNNSAKEAAESLGLTEAEFNKRQKKYAV
ncbi:MAG: sigma-54-dependent Fis family transcriptional regulator [Herpetosiphon sp.]|nr:sigma-54-dependent Fis family transcriptional regulator [Herpetosiphon sp.]